MHILLTNDDGPPSAEASPNVHTFAQILQAPPFNHKVSVVLPSTQRSWIGKAHLLPPSKLPLPQQSQPHLRSVNETVTDHLTPTYYDPKTGEAHALPPKDGSEYYVLVPGTPATCVQLGLFHHAALFPNSSTTPSKLNDAETPIDFVISGPNHGRNTTAAFALSSGTLGGALEASVVGVRAIAISFAFFSRDEIAPHVEKACIHSAKIVEKLMNEWTELASRCSRQADGPPLLGCAPDIYTINVPLMKDLSEKPIKWTWLLDNKWKGGSLYKPIPTDQDADAAGGSAQKEQKQAGSQGPSFKWSPSFIDLLKVLENSPDGNDGKTIREGCTSVTPLRANFESVWGRGTAFEGEFKL